MSEFSDALESIDAERRSAPDSIGAKAGVATLGVTAVNFETSVVEADDDVAGRLCTSAEPSWPK